MKKPPLSERRYIVGTYPGEQARVYAGWEAFRPPEVIAEGLTWDEARAKASEFNSARRVKQIEAQDRRSAKHIGNPLDIPNDNFFRLRLWQDSVSQWGKP